MAIIIKTEPQIAKMREAGRIVEETHLLLEKHICVGITTKELDTIAEKFIRSQGAVPSFLGYRGYPASINVSVNEQIIHGIPGSRKLKEGDVVSVDIGACKDGYHGDAARTHAVGKISDEAKKLIEITRLSFFEGLKYAKDGNNLNDICEAIGNFIYEHGYTAVREYGGHGIGRNLHEDPHVSNVKLRARGPKLTKGMTLAIEPMVNMGACDIDVLSDGWTVVTKDGKLSAHYENTLLITDGEPELLTLSKQYEEG